MGIISTLADLGSVGSTTKWALSAYKSLKSKNKTIKDADIYQIMMLERYKKIKIKPKEKFEYYRGDKFMVYQGQVAEYHAGLTGLIIEILNVEADLWRNNVKALIEILKPLSTRMLKETDLSNKTKYGELSIFKIDGNFEMEWIKFIMDNYKRVDIYRNYDSPTKEEFYNNALKLIKKNKT